MSYRQVVDHLDMAFDEHRNQQYRDALAKHIGPDSVVMDLGAGIGILGFIALALGARKVLMIEPTPAIHAARNVARALGVEDRIEFLNKPVEDCGELEPVDCMVSVFTGNFLLEEDLLPSLFVARDRYLRDGGILLPDFATMALTPVFVPAYYENRIDRWQTPVSGIDLSSLRSFAANSIYPVTFGDPASRLLAPAVDFFDLDFNTATSSKCSASCTVTINEAGTCHGLLGWFSARLGDTWLSTGPEAPGTHWSQVLLPVSEPFSVEPGDHLEVTIDRPPFGEWTWSVTNGETSQRQSTFLANPRAVADFGRKTEGFRPRLNAEGDIARNLLAAFDGKKSRAELADMARSAPGSITAEQSRRLLDNLIQMFADTGS